MQSSYRCNPNGTGKLGQRSYHATALQFQVRLTFSEFLFFSHFFLTVTVTIITVNIVTVTIVNLRITSSSGRKILWSYFNKHGIISSVKQNQVKFSYIWDRMKLYVSKMNYGNKFWCKN